MEKSRGRFSVRAPRGATTRKSVAAVQLLCMKCHRTFWDDPSQVPGNLDIECPYCGTGHFEEVGAAGSTWIGQGRKEVEGRF